MPDLLADPVAWSVVILAMFLIGLTKSGFGSGVGLMIVPMTAIALGYTPLGSEGALGLLLPLLLIGDVIAVAQHRRHVDWPSIRRLAAGTIVGIALGAGLLWLLKQNSELVGALIRIEIGIESALLVGLHYWRQLRGLQQKLWPEPFRGSLTGGFAGASSTLAHAAGPIIAMYLLPLKLDRRIFVGTCAVYFFAVNATKVPFYVLARAFDATPWLLCAASVPIVLGGAVFGRWLNTKLSDKVFTGIVYAVTGLLGIYLLIDGVIKVIEGW